MSATIIAFDLPCSPDLEARTHRATCCAITKDGGEYKVWVGGCVVHRPTKSLRIAKNHLRAELAKRFRGAIAQAKEQIGWAVMMQEKTATLDDCIANFPCVPDR